MYYRYCSFAELEEEYDAAIPLWVLLVIIVQGLLPVADIILFTAFIIYCAIHAGWNPDECEGCTHVFSLRGENIVTRGLLKVKNLLCKRV